MFAKLRMDGAWSALGLRLLIVSIVMCVLLSVLDGVLHGVFGTGRAEQIFLRIVIYWVNDFRALFEQGVYASTVFLVGAKFFETRTIFTVGFDRLDGSKVAVKGPDDDNTVWIGRRYDSPREAQTVATAMAGRLQEDRAPA